MNLAFIYPGQGSQTANMGLSFIENFEVAKSLVEQASNALELDFLELLKDEKRLAISEFTQPAIFLVSAIAQKVFELECGKKPLLAFGHSLGEVSAYGLNGGFSVSSGVVLTNKRAKLMSESCNNYAKTYNDTASMLVSLGLKKEEVKLICAREQANGLEVYPANFNLENQIVIAGLKSHLEKLASILKTDGAKRAMLLNMSVASHCPLLKEAVSPFKDLLKDTIKDCDVRIISNTHAEFYQNACDAELNLSNQLIMPVLYTDCLQKALNEGVDAFIEFGNGSVLSGLNSKMCDIKTFSINDISSLKECIANIK